MNFRICLLLFIHTEVKMLTLIHCIHSGSNDCCSTVCPTMHVFISKFQSWTLVTNLWRSNACVGGTQPPTVCIAKGWTTCQCIGVSQHGLLHLRPCPCIHSNIHCSGISYLFIIFCYLIASIPQKCGKHFCSTCPLQSSYGSIIMYTCACTYVHSRSQRSANDCCRESLVVNRYLNVNITRASLTLAICLSHAVYMCVIMS